MSSLLMSNEILPTPDKKKFETISVYEPLPFMQVRILYYLLFNFQICSIML
jgi:hypothetical protein